MGVMDAFSLSRHIFSFFLVRYHTVVMLKESGRLLSFGLNKSGQLGCTTSKPLIETTPPFVVEGEWLPYSTLEEFAHGSPVDKGNVVKRIFAGGNQSFAIIYPLATIKEDVRIKSN